MPSSSPKACVSRSRVSITSGSDTSRSGATEDTGGPDGEYGDNENFTFTICPDVPGNANLPELVVPQPEHRRPNDDNITIGDGDNTSAITLGSYSGTSLQGLVVSGTVFNTSGCLTLVFQSNGTGTGNFAAGFNCTIPCLNPTSAATMPEGHPRVDSLGEEVTFNGSGSSAQPGYTHRAIPVGLGRCIGG
ncbi:MAG: hypothetical protein IPG11_13955 [Flavobacteriales bacterium]|nr:hypothetical protein [Flavobacteriales bacterium]